MWSNDNSPVVTTPAGEQPDNSPDMATSAPRATVTPIPLKLTAFGEMHKVIAAYIAMGVRAKRVVMIVETDEELIMDATGDKARPSEIAGICFTAACEAAR